jgi:SAM-dependent methyltransferase
MGDVNQLTFVQKHAGAVSGKVLEVGSKDYGNTPDYRPLFAAQGYVGADMEPGDGVDVVLDLTQDFSTLDERLAGERFGGVICNSVLEHCSDPFKMASNISKLVDVGGVLFLSAPFAWRVHGYPQDYWRFTPDGLKILFPDFEFFDESLATANEGEFAPVTHEMFRVDLLWEKARERRLYSFATAAIIYVLRRLGRVFPRVYLFRALRQPYLLRPVNVLLAGRKR